MNPALYQLPVPEGTRLTLARLYDDVDDQNDVRAWDEWKEGRPAVLPPFCYRFAGDKCRSLCEALRRGHTAVTDDLAALTKLGVIQRARRDGRWGWELLGLRASPPPAGSGSTDPGVRPAGPAGPDLQTPGSAQPDPLPPRRVRPAGPPGPPSRTRGSARPDLRARAFSTELTAVQRQQAQRGRGRDEQPDRTAGDVVHLAGWRSSNSKEGEMGIKKATPASRSPAESRLIDLANEIGGAFVQSTAEGVELRSSRIRATDDVLGFLRRLVDEHGFDVVRSYVLDYAEVCRSNGLEALRWKPNMLCDVRRGDRTKSAWEMLVIRVDEWRVARDAATKRKRDAEATAETEARAAAEQRETQAKLAADTLSPVEVKAGIDAFLAHQPSPPAPPQQLGLRGVLGRVVTPVRPRSPVPAGQAGVAGQVGEITAADEERMRGQGRWRQSHAARAQADADEAAHTRLRRMCEALRLAEQRGSPLTPAEITALRGEATG